MKLAQTILSELAANRPAVAKRLDCGVLSAALPRLQASPRAQSGDESPQSRRFAPFEAADGFVALNSEYVAPTELKNFLVALATKIPLRRSCSKLRGISGVSLAPWLQPGAGCRRETLNRFNGFPSRAEAVETAGEFTPPVFHRAEATVLMKGGKKNNFPVASANREL
jgi:hypothetical protein